MYGYKHCCLSGAAIAVIAISLSTPMAALAQTSPSSPAPSKEGDPETTSDDIVVTGIRASIRKALEIKRQSNVIVDSITAEDIGKMPDANLAEALQRVAGVSIDRSDGGEGRRVSIRGLSAGFTSVLLNGRRIATSEPDRSFGFDTIAADLVSGVDVYKTQESFIREGGVGGTINARTRRPMDASGPVFQIQTENNYESSSKKVTPGGAFLFSHTFLDDRVGILISGKYQRRRLREYSSSAWDASFRRPFSPQTAQNTGATGGDTSLMWPDNNGVLQNIRGLWQWQGWEQAYGLGGKYPTGYVYGPSGIRFQVTDTESERIGGTVALQVRPTDTIEVNVDYLQSKYDVRSTSTTAGAATWYTSMPPAEAAAYIRQNYGSVVGANVADAWANFVVANSKSKVDANGVVTYMNSYPGTNWVNGGNWAGFTHRPERTQVLGFNTKWQPSNKFTLTFDAAYSNAERDDKGNALNASVLPDFWNTSGSWELDNTTGNPFFTNVTGNAMVPDVNSPYMRMIDVYRSGNDISAKNYEFSLDGQWQPDSTLSVRFGALYEVGSKQSYYYSTAGNTPCFYDANDPTNITPNASSATAVSTRFNNCNVSNISSKFNYAGGTSNLTNAQRDSIILGLSKPDPSKFGWPAHAFTQALRLSKSGIVALQNNPAFLNNMAWNAFPAGNREPELYTVNLWAQEHGGDVTGAGNTGQGFDVTEKVFSPYLNVVKEMSVFGIPVTVTAGLRYSRTETEATGFSQVLVGLARDPNNIDPTVLQATYQTGNLSGPDGRWSGALSTITVKRTYSDWLPDLSAKFLLTNNLILRFGLSKSLSRPQLDVLSPYFNWNSAQFRTTTRTVSANNPYLNPVRSKNADVAAEWYYGPGKAVSFDAFYKNIDGLVVDGTTTFDVPTLVNGTEYSSFTVFTKVNADPINVYGANIGWTHTFGFGGGFQLNYSWTGSNWRYDPVKWKSTEISLPGLSDNANAVLFFERFGISARVAYNWRGKFLSGNTGWNGDTGTEPTFARSYETVDARVAYTFDNGLQLFVGGTNLFNQPIWHYGRFENLLADRTSYGTRVTLGASFKF